MSHNLISLTLSADQLTAIAGALSTLEQTLTGLTALNVADERRTLVKMGDKSEAFAQQTLIALSQNTQLVPQLKVVGKGACLGQGQQALSSRFGRQSKATSPYYAGGERMNAARREKSLNYRALSLVDEAKNSTHAKGSARGANGLTVGAASSFIGAKSLISVTFALVLGLGSSTCMAEDAGSKSMQAPTMAASFECGKAASLTEKLICKDAQTSALDGRLQQAYKAALKVTNPASKKTLIEEQRHWITYTRNLCMDTACLQQVYTARVAMLALNEKDIIDTLSCAVPDGSTACINVVAYRDPSIRIRSFNQSLAQAKQAGKIVGCSRLINLPVGTVGSNNSFGGICTMQDGAQRKSVEICDDDMFGHFERQPAEPQDVSDKNLIDFTHEHCFGG